MFPTYGIVSNLSIIIAILDLQFNEDMNTIRT